VPWRSKHPLLTGHTRRVPQNKRTPISYESDPLMPVYMYQKLSKGIESKNVHKALLQLCDKKISCKNIPTHINENTSFN
jgi:hypothetical protein